MPTKTAIAKPIDSKELFAPGHRACAGCGQSIAARVVANALGPNTIIANATGCLEVTTTPFPESAWGMPWIHSLFENAAAVASGVLAALKYKKLDKEVKVVAQGGDGSTFDIGFGLISGMWERGDNVLYICYDNEAYSNTGMQASGATPFGSNTTTTPVGEGKGAIEFGSGQRKKDMPAIAVAHGLKYAAQTTIGFLEDVKQKIAAGLATDGPAYIQIMVPCVPGWRIKPDQTLQVARLGAQTGLYPIFEYIEGRLAKVMKVPKPTPPVDEYLKLQGRFAHLFKGDKGKQELAYIQSIADSNIKKYGL